MAENLKKKRRGIIPLRFLLKNFPKSQKCVPQCLFIFAILYIDVYIKENVWHKERSTTMI